MKTTLFFFGLFFTITASFAQTTPIPDPIFEQDLVNSGIDTNGLTGDILNSDAVGVTFLNLDFQSISDLTGIEAFASLQTLRVSGNLLTSLDVSSNTMLTVLNCDSNMLNSLDVTQNVLLEELRAGLNMITTIDVSQNPSLRILSINDNLLTSINVTQNVALEELFLENNGSLSSLDVTQNSVLRHLSAQFCNLTNIDVTQNVALEQLILRFMAFSTNIDVSQNVALIQLDVRMCELTTIDVSNNSALTVLRASSNILLTSLNVKNGNNHNMGNFGFYAQNSPNLMCIQVDDVAYSNATWSNIDAQQFFSTDCSLGIDDNELSNFKFYPNPAGDEISIKLIREHIYSVFNLNGQLVKTGKLMPGENILKLDDLSKGLYILNIKNESSDISNKLVKL